MVSRARALALAAVSAACAGALAWWTSDLAAAAARAAILALVLSLCLVIVAGILPTVRSNERNGWAWRQDLFGPPLSVTPPSKSDVESQRATLGVAATCALILFGSSVMLGLAALISWKA
jgi:hypothetical protein